MASLFITWHNVQMANSELMAKYIQDLDEAHAQLLGISNPIEQAFANKAILQTAVLGFDKTETAFEAEKPIDIGIFRVFPTEAAMDWRSPSGELEISIGQTYLDFHIPKSDSISNAAANEGYSQIAEIMQSRPNIIYIIGVTYSTMAISAKRNQGFNIEEIPLPEVVMNYASAFWQNMMPDAKARQFQTAHIVWQDRENFISRFAN